MTRETSGRLRPPLVLSLRARSVLLAGGIAFITATLISALSYYWVQRLTLEQAEAKLKANADLIVPQLQLTFDRMLYDAIAVSHMPPFQGLIRAQRSGGVDPRDGSTTALWRQRLETIFASIMAYQPTYVQMRYIGIAGNGLELVRSNRAADGSIQAVPVEAMQRKGDEPYFQRALALPRDAASFSTVTLNREHGKTQSDLTVIRAIAPVHDANGKMFGMLVINADFNALMRRALSRIEAAGDLYVVDEAGNYIERRRGRTVSTVTLAGAGSMPALLRAAESAPRDGRLLRVNVDGADMVAARANLAFDRGDESRQATVLVAAPRDEILADAFAVRNRALLASLVVVAIMSLLGFAAGGRLVQPLHRLTLAVRGYRPGARELALPTERHDEIGELAIAFDNLVHRLEDAREAERSLSVRQQAILEGMGDGLVMIDEYGTIKEFNPSAQALFGYSREEMIGQNVKRLMSAADAEGHDDHLARYRETGKKNIIGRLREESVRTKDGRSITVEISTSEFELADGRHFNATVRDISARKAMEAALERQATALRRSNADLEEFAYIASHDLKEPLRAISNHVQFLSEDHEEALGEDGKRRVARIKALCARADKLISELLFFSRLGREEMQDGKVDMEALLADVRDNLGDLLTTANAVVEQATPLPPVKGDAPRLTSLLHNLIVNGIKYNDQTEKRIEIGYAPSAQGDAYFVRDNGIGIPEQFESAVFKIFKRLHSEKAYGPGTGAGLSFAKKIVERHGGELWFDSAPDKGTTFYFNLREAS